MGMGQKVKSKNTLRPMYLHSRLSWWSRPTWDTFLTLRNVKGIGWPLPHIYTQCKQQSLTQNYRFSHCTIFSIWPWSAWFTLRGYSGMIQWSAVWVYIRLSWYLEGAGQDVGMRHCWRWSCVCLCKMEGHLPSSWSLYSLLECFIGV